MADESKELSLPDESQTTYVEVPPTDFFDTKMIGGKHKVLTDQEIEERRFQAEMSGLRTDSEWATFIANAPAERREGLYKAWHHQQVTNEEYKHAQYKRDPLSLFFHYPEMRVQETTQPLRLTAREAAMRAQVAAEKFKDGVNRLRNIKNT
jgi:hypothetical protein